MRGSTHLCNGQEACSVGACEALHEGDSMVCTYRGHGAVLAMGAPLDRTFAEILGRATGLCRGKGGSMHLTDVSVGAYGSFAIVGAHLPIATGLALAAKQEATGAVSLCFFGDGSVNIGAFHEAMNLAAIWRLPVIFFCENNLYGEYSALASTTPVSELATRAAAYAMPGVRVDGNAIGEAAVVRPGEHATVVATQLVRGRAQDAADALAGAGIEVELIDPRTVLPLDADTIGRSVDKTNHLVVQESPLPGSWGATVAATVVRDRFESLDAPPVLICGADTPVPYAGGLEDAWLPDADRIAAEIRALLDG